MNTLPTLSVTEPFLPEQKHRLLRGKLFCMDVPYP